MRLCRQRELCHRLELKHLRMQAHRKRTRLQPKQNLVSATIPPTVPIHPILGQLHGGMIHGSKTRARPVQLARLSRIQSQNPEPQTFLLTTKKEILRGILAMCQNGIRQTLLRSVAAQQAHHPRILINLRLLGMIPRGGISTSMISLKPRVTIRLGVMQSVIVIRVSLLPWNPRTLEALRMIMRFLQGKTLFARTLGRRASRIRVPVQTLALRRLLWQSLQKPTHLLTMVQKVWTILIKLTLINGTKRLQRRVQVDGRTLTLLEIGHLELYRLTAKKDLEVITPGSSQLDQIR